MGIKRKLPSCRSSSERASKPDDFSCWDEYADFLEQDLTEGKENLFSGQDCYGCYKAYGQRDSTNMLVIRRYFYPNGRLKRMGRFLNEGLIRTEEWSENGGRQCITSYDGAEEWLWEKDIDYTRQKERFSINQDAFVFRGIPEGHIRALEDGDFNPAWLLESMGGGFREIVLEVLGVAKVIPSLPMIEIDHCGPNRLLRFSWEALSGNRHDEPWVFAEVHCTSTGKITYLRVPPGFSDIMSAIAWTFETDKENYLLDEET